MIFDIDLSDLGPPQDSELTIIIPIVPVPNRYKPKQLNPVDRQLLNVLREMRRNGYEVDIYLRGTWAYGTRVNKVLNDYKLENWRLTDEGIEYNTTPGAFHTWVPMVNRRPRPEIVLKGVKSTGTFHNGDKCL